MMEFSSDPYEQKLFNMFQSHDPNENGLDETALIKLCISLELNDQGNYLIKSLIKNSDSRVTFKAFKEALLNFLGEINSSGGGGDNNMEAKTLVITSNDNNDKKYLNDGPISPGREISPKLIMGTKKYGRRSRPQSLVTDSSHTDSEDDDDDHNNRSDEIGVVTNINNKLQKVQRSSSQSEIHGNRRRRPTSGGTKLKRCASLPAQKKQQQQLQINQQQNPKEKLLAKNQTANLLKEKDQKQITSSVESLDIPQQLETVPANSIIEMWETSNINDAKALLSNLGFDDDEIHVGQLTKVLEEELRGSNGETQMILLKASLAIQKAEVTALQLSFRQLYDENKKLHSDNKDANKRATLLAQEIDERHANLEDSTKTEIRLLEQRHTEVIRDLTAQLASDRENWSNLNVRLEKRIKILEQDEIRLKNELQSVKDENMSMENEQLSIQKQITNLLEANIKLNNELVELEEKQRNDDNIKETEEVLELIDKIHYLQVENTNLRDKNDELTSELEGLNIELNRTKYKKLSTPPITSSIISPSSAPIGGLSNNINSNNDTSTEILSDDPEHSSLGIKRRGDSPSKAKLTEESPRTGKLRKCNNDNCNNSNSESETSGDWVALNSELNNISTINHNNSVTVTTSGFSQDYSSISDIKDDEIKILKENINKLENELKELQENQIQTKTNSDDVINKTKPDCETLETRCKDLEASLDQMRKAYEDCEDYWQTKLNEERQMFDKERQIYEDEQIESDKKFTELMEKVREYEEQYSKDDRLSTIDEKDVLEQQFADMEAEVEETRENARKMFDEKTKEIDLLRQQIQQLNIRLIESGNNINDDGLLKTNSLLVNDQQQKTQQQSSELESPASSPISYLWNQSTIQAPARDYQNPNWSNNKIPLETSRIDNLTTSETSIFSTNNETNNDTNESEIKSSTILQPLNPIQKPTSSLNGGGSIKSTNCINDDNSSNTSVKSFESHSVASTHSVQKSSIAELSTCSSPNGMKEELKRLKYFEVQLREQIKDLAIKRDSLVMELQQLQEAKPVLEKAYARAAHPTLIQRVNMLEQKNRHLQTVLRQQQQYTESIMHQTWQQQRTELTELRNRLETQGIIMTEQAQRLAQADLLVKDLYVENSHLSATIQRLEQQRSRANILQHHHHHQQQSGLNGVPGMP